MRHKKREEEYDAKIQDQGSSKPENREDVMTQLMSLRSEESKTGEQEADQRARICHFRKHFLYQESLVVVSSRRAEMVTTVAPSGIPRNIVTLLASAVHETAKSDSAWLRL